MNVPTELGFDFDFGAASRAELLEQAATTAKGLGVELGEGTEGAGEGDAASRLLTELGREIAEFSAYPDVLELKEEHFAAQGLSVPPRFKDQSERFRFYWLYFPITLRALENLPFSRLKCAVEFNPGVVEGHLRPRAEMILPERRFRKLLEVSDSIELRIGENFEFEAAAAGQGVLPGQATAKMKAEVDAKAAGKLGLMAGPFTYTLKKAQVDHSPVGSEKVFWSVEGGEFFEETTPTFIVVLKVPKGVERVEVAAALQAYHRFGLLAASLGDVIRYFGERLATFFRKGAPTEDKQVWDISTSL